MRKALVSFLALVALLVVTSAGYAKNFPDGRSATEVFIVDANGNALTFSGSGFGDATAANQVTGNTALSNINSGIATLHTDLTQAIAVVHTSSDASTMTGKASDGTQIAAYAESSSPVDGRFIAYNATSVPSDGALTGANVLACKRITAFGHADFNDLPSIPFSTGIVYILSTGADCYTKTTGSIVGYISAQVQ
jgi:hypothetical protein